MVPFNHKYVKRLTLGSMLRDIRLKRSLKVKQVVAEIGLSNAIISNLERGLSVDAAAKITTLLSYYGVDEREFYSHLDVANERLDKKVVDLKAEKPFLTYEKLFGEVLKRHYNFIELFY